MSGPIGGLYLDALARAKKKTGGQHVSEDTCGCRVSVNVIGPGCHTTKFEHCTDHEPPRDAKGKKR